jgi:hypothetical protein
VNELPLAGFQHAIKAMHGAEAELVGREYVIETFDGEEVWRGEVLTFSLAGNPDADRCFAWEVDGRVTAVLAVGRIQAPLDAVRAAIIASDASE